MTSLPVGIRLWSKHRASTSAEDTSALVEFSELAVFWTAGGGGERSPPSSAFDTSALAWAIHGSAAPIVGSICLTDGMNVAANRCVGPNDLSSAVSAASVRR